MKSPFVKARRKASQVKIDYGKAPRPALSIPDQSLSIKEILTRYTRGVPVDVRTRRPVYVDQDEFDLEKLSRMEFSDKMSIAEQLRAEYDAQIADLEAKASARRQAIEEAKRAAEAARSAPAETKKEPEKGSKA